MCFFPVLEDGIELRSGKSLKTLREMIHEHDTQVNQTDIVSTSVPYSTSKLLSVSRKDQYNISANAYTRSTGKKLLKSRENNKQYSQSDQKNKYYDRVNMDSRTSALFDKNSIRSRRALNTEFDRKLLQNNNRQLASGEVKGYRRSHDDVDSRPSGYSVRTVRTTVTEEFEERDNDVREKGAIEMSEKATRSAQKENLKSNICLYGRLCSLSRSLLVKVLNEI